VIKVFLFLETKENFSNLLINFPSQLINIFTSDGINISKIKPEYGSHYDRYQSEIDAFVKATDITLKQESEDDLNQSSEIILRYNKIDKENKERLINEIREMLKRETSLTDEKIDEIIPRDSKDINIDTVLSKLNNLLKPDISEKLIPKILEIENKIIEEQIKKIKEQISSDL
jgi:hypothetical protein